MKIVVNSAQIIQPNLTKVRAIGTNNTFDNKLSYCEEKLCFKKTILIKIQLFLHCL